MYKVQINNNKITIEDSKTVIFESELAGIEQSASFDIFGIYGVVSFNSRKLLVLVKEAKKVGKYKESDVFEISNVSILAISSLENKPRELNHIKKLIQHFFKLPGVYFSQTNLHRNLAIPEMDQKYERDFLFNKKPIENLMKMANENDHQLQESNPAVLKCIQGFFRSEDGITLISRRCPKRAGSRYFSRGVNKEGYPSNFVETEQIVGDGVSYLQLRGSIPLKWKHEVNLRYRPSIHLEEENTREISHSLLQNIYKKPVKYLNLIHSSGYESILYEKFNEFYEIFNYDIKKEFNDAKKMKKIRKMIELSCEMEGNRFHQKEIIRSNCIDCLDRTNSMQYIIGCEVLRYQLKSSDDQESTDKIKQHRRILQRLYYDNGNNLSLQYAGTKAMATYLMEDSGSNLVKRLEDVYLSLSRYFINRYHHGYLHDSYEIVTGVREHGNISRSFGMKYILLIFVPLFVGIALKIKISNGFKCALIFLIVILFAVILGEKAIDYPTS